MHILWNPDREATLELYSGESNIPRSRRIHTRTVQADKYPYRPGYPDREATYIPKIPDEGRPTKGASKEFTPAARRRRNVWKKERKKVRVEKS
ncbi:hypothetical protein HHI36_009996 [Cryptolaemus montrouzieri]|uniref:Uncharacterized protein n=1 Tax=Cryptolaemus montrouzieri TaxID=559131 RepID=A0ABD2MHF1_9CUCU